MDGSVIGKYAGKYVRYNPYYLIITSGKGTQFYHGCKTMQVSNGLMSLIFSKLLQRWISDMGTDDPNFVSKSG